MAANDEAIAWYQNTLLCVHGYHVYKEKWEAASGKTLVSVAEPGNSDDRHTAAVKKDGKVIGYLP